MGLGWSGMKVWVWYWTENVWQDSSSLSFGMEM